MRRRKIFDSCAECKPIVRHSGQYALVHPGHDFVGDVSMSRVSPPGEHICPKPATRVRPCSGCEVSPFARWRDRQGIANSLRDCLMHPMRVVCLDSPVFPIVERLAQTVTRMWFTSSCRRLDSSYLA